MADKNLPEPRQSQQGLTIRDLLQSEKCRRAIADSCPKGISWEAIHRSAIITLQRNPKLLKANPLELMRQFLAFSQIGLQVDTPLQHGWVLPFENNRAGTVELQSVIGYQGMVELMYRSGKVIGLQADIVVQAEIDERLFEWEKGTKPFLTHRYSAARDETDEETFVAAYAVAQMHEASEFEVMMMAPIHKIRNGSPGYRYASKRKAEGKKTDNPWMSSPTAMAKKTVLRQMFKLLPKTNDMALASMIDEAGERQASLGDFLDLDPSNWTAEPASAQVPAGTDEIEDKGKQPEKKAAAKKKATPKKDAKQAEKAADSDIAQPRDMPKEESEGDPRPEPPMEGEVIPPEKEEATEPEPEPEKEPEPEAAEDGGESDAEEEEDEFNWAEPEEVV